MSNNSATTDPDGGLTKFGISQKQHPEVDVASLTQGQALDWYLKNMWTPYGGDTLAWPVCLVVFDGVVNQGPSVSSEALQNALGVDPDGDIGPVTVTAASRRDPQELAARVIAKRAMSYTTDKEWKGNGEGWMYRLATQCLKANQK